MATQNKRYRSGKNEHGRWIGKMQPPTKVTRLGTLFIKARVNKGWTIEELARRAVVHKSQVFKIEDGLTLTPEFHTIARLTHVLGIDANEVIAAVIPAQWRKVGGADG